MGAYDQVQVDDTRALIYLMEYGYVESEQWSSSLVTQEALKGFVTTAVRDFQAFAGINQTGELDQVTKDLMRTPRCGVKDIIGHGATHRRKKRYVLQGSRWQKKDLTYRVAKYTSGNKLRKFEIDQELQKAFTLWEGVSGLTFTRKNFGNVDIEIRFESYEHGDGDAFDGPGGTLAHAYFPQFGGDIHLDDTERWTISSYDGTNLLQTLAHEIGHSLGLSHSDVSSAIMAPFYKGYKPGLSLDKDDIRAIQALYGQHVPKPTPSPKPFLQPPSNPLCSDSSVDATVRTGDGTSYVFKRSQYWELTRDSVKEGYPRRIEDDWSGLPGNLDAALTWEKTGATYFFKGNSYWKFKNKSPVPGYPKSMRDGWPGIPSGVDSAFVWGGNGKIYFTKNDKYWKFDPERKPHVQQSQYPKPISEWGLPRNIDGAFQWENGLTYFFKGRDYWRFNDRTFNIDKASPPFPRPSGPWWFGCSQ
jgi:matrix metalloproteinase-14 (membrane-inserted)